MTFWALECYTSAAIDCYTSARDGSRKVLIFLGFPGEGKDGAA